MSNEVITTETITESSMELIAERAHKEMIEMATQDG